MGVIGAVYLSAALVARRGEPRSILIVLGWATPFIVLLVAWLLYAYKIITVDAAGFHMRDLWGTRTELPWEQVGMLRGTGGVSGYVVGHASGDTRVELFDSSGGEELLALVRQVKPDLWDRFDRAKLTKGDHAVRDWLSSAGLAVLGVIWTLTAIVNENYALMGLYAVLTVVPVCISLGEIVAVQLEPDGVRVRRRWRQRLVPRADVADFVPRARGGGVYLVKHDGGRVALGRMEGGTEYMLEVLRAWLTA